MSRKFESADPLRRGSRRPPVSALKAAAMRMAAQKQRPVEDPANSANLTQKQPPESMQSSGFQEFALKMCTDEDVQDSRYHILKFHSKTPVDPANQFVPPIRLHRKDPRQLQLLAGQEEEGGSEAGMEVDQKPDISSGGNAAGSAGAGTGGNGASGASGAGGASGATAGATGGAGGTAGAGENGTNKEVKKRPFGRKRKTRQIHGGEKNDAARKLRYEEYYPWIMEDFDNKNTWISSFEAAQSENHAVLTYDAASNGFKLIPIEKFYKMTPSAKYATLSLEDAEERMENAHSMRDRWLMSHLQPRQGGHTMPSTEQFAQQPARMRTVVGSEERQHKYNMDEEMDFDDQEMFDDDEGAPILDGPEEDLKEAEERIKREQLKANELMDAGNNEDIDDLFDDEETREGKQGRKLRKALRSLEKNQYYDTDEEENPYVSSPDEESDSDAELDAQTAAATAAAAAAAAAANGEPGGVAVKREEDADDAGILPISQFRKKHINRDSLPRGTIVLQLPPNVLGKFQKGEWNPNAKREASAPLEKDPKLLTREDVRNNIVSGQTDIKQLLNALRPKLSQHKDNMDRLRQFVKEVARSRDRKLYLRN